ncbi:MAG: triose-phosphate isomerase [SAR324 cluster bacterium]|nr:triose-phosphate isomerase [SAR324 cluster bacterium]
MNKTLRHSYFIGNWKMNLGRAEAKELIKGELSELPGDSYRVVLAPPFLLMPLVSDLIGGSSLLLAGQNCYKELKGAFTGEISPLMLKEAGATYCIVGHSERREYFFETNDLVREKIVILLEQQIIPVLCVGETKEEREANRHFEKIKVQLSSVYDSLSKSERAKIIIAYEPIWAIGTGLTASSQQASEMHKFIRDWLASTYGDELAFGTSILYGGSVKKTNAKELFAKEDIDGFLVGGASLNAKDFLAVIVESGA